MSQIHCQIFCSWKLYAEEYCVENTAESNKLTDCAWDPKICHWFLLCRAFYGKANQFQRHLVCYWAATYLAPGFRSRRNHVFCSRDLVGSKNLRQIIRRNKSKIKNRLRNLQHSCQYHQVSFGITVFTPLNVCERFKYSTFRFKYCQVLQCSQYCQVSPVRESTIHNIWMLNIVN